MKRIPWSSLRDLALWLTVGAFVLWACWPLIVWLGDTVSR